ncbi:MAG: tetratricopeptide repeat protein [Planctomycetota bacterium]|jgi:tetratricopeptide (TPR) repeat protein
MRYLLIFSCLAAAVLAGGADQAAALLKKGDAKRAAEAAQRLADKDPANIDAWVVLADALVALGEPADAWEKIEVAIEKNPKEARLSMKLGDVFLKMAERELAGARDATAIQNYYLDAERNYGEALEKDGKLADALYGQAYANFYMNRKEKARELISKCLDMQRDHGRCLALQAYVFYTERKYVEAATIYENALKADDSDPIDMVRYGHCLLVLKKTDEAKAAYLAAVKRHPENDIAIRSGLLNLAGKSYDKLKPWLEEATKTIPNSSKIWFHLGYANFRAKDYKAAEKCFRKAIKIATGQTDYHYYLGHCLEAQGNARGALDEYRKSLKLNSAYSLPMAQFEGIILGMSQDIDAAEKLYDELLELAPNNGWIRNNYALMLRNWAEARGAAKDSNPAPAARKRIKRSGEVYEQAAAILTKEAQVQSDCGLLFEFYPVNRDDKKAEQYFTEALVISEWTYRDAWSGILRLARRTKNWELMKEHAEGMIGALEGRGLNVVAPVGGGAPRELKNETPRILEQAKSALRLAEKRLGE